jgi:hypothetical protein
MTDRSGIHRSTGTKGRPIETEADKATHLALSKNGVPNLTLGVGALFGANHGLMANLNEPEVENLTGGTMIKIKVRNNIFG